MKKTTRLLFAALLSALLLAGCSTAPSLPPVNENDLARIASEPADTAAITADIPEGIYITGEEPNEITFSWNGDAELRWTSNCATPEADSDLAENGTVPLTYKNTGDDASWQSTIRCALFKNGERISDVQTFVYTHAAEDRFTMPVVTLVGDKDDLYSYDRGILVAGKLSVGANPVGWQAWYHAANYYMRGIEWERPIAVSVFDERGSLRFSGNGGLRASGGYTRYNTQKSLRIYARKTYTPDSGVFPYAFWGNLRGSQTGTPVSYSDTVLFRGGSNNEHSSLFTTPALLLLLEGTSVDTPAVQTVVEYINGAYKGVVTQLEDFDEDYFEHHYGVPKEHLTTVKGSVGEVFEKGGWRIDDGPREELNTFNEMLQFVVRKDMSDPENYAKACEMLDIRNFIEYFAYEAFIFNTDWPQNNMRVWRYNGNDTEDGYNPAAEGVFDGRWRFLPKDLDLSFGYQNSAKSANPYVYMSESCSLLMKNCWSSLMKNEEFADLFYTYMCTLAGEVMTYERCSAMFDLVQVYTGREVAVSAVSLGVVSGSRGHWNNSFDTMRKFALSRGPAVIRFTKTETKRNLSDVSVQIEGDGTVQLGWYDISSGAVREYLRDTRIPLEFSRDGEISVTGGHIDGNGYLTAEDASCVVTVVFPAEESVEKNEPQSIVLNEVRFRGDGIEWIELYNPTDKAIPLDGWSLGKDRTADRAQEFAATVIEPDGYALICCTDYSNSAGIEGLQIPMSLGNGDTLTLFDETGETVDTMLLETPSKYIHLGRYPDAGDVIQLSSDEATPGTENVIAEYGGAFTSDNFKPYMLAWGRAYKLDDYFYEKDGETYVRRNALYALCDERAATSSLTLWLKKQKTDMPLDDLIAESAEMDGPTVRRVEELDSLIIG